jgi:hypothetical protein
VNTLHTGEGAMSPGVREYVLRGDGMIARDDTRTSGPPSVEEAKKKFLHQALPCPLCKTPPEELSWVYLVIPDWACKDAEEREGWVTICDRCKLQVDFFIEKR